MADLFSAPAPGEYSARDIEVLEGLEPVRRRPGMYIGGSDEAAMHHLVAELLDNAMDEAVAGHASFIDLELGADDVVTVRDNGRGIPIDPHPKFPDKSALEVILTTLHSGGKFSGSSYDVAGGLHGVGLSVVNALAETLTVEVARDRRAWRQSYRRGAPAGGVEANGGAPNRRGTSVTFAPDRTIFPESARFRPAALYRMARSKAYLFRGVEVRWKCAPDALAEDDATPARAVLHFPGGLGDYLDSVLEGAECVTPRPFRGEVALAGGAAGRVEWALAWRADGDPRLPQLLLQHRADVRGRHARSGSARSARQGPARPRRTREEPPREGHRGRGRPCRRPRPALPFHLRSAIPGSDQGAPVLARRGAARRSDGARPFRSLAGAGS